jgi:hypothetical protein
MKLVASVDRLDDLAFEVEKAKRDVRPWRIDATPVDGPFGIEWEFELREGEPVNFPEGPRAA